MIWKAIIAIELQIPSYKKFGEDVLMIASYTPHIPGSRP